MYKQFINIKNYMFTPADHSEEYRESWDTLISVINNFSMYQK